MNGCLIHSRLIRGLAAGCALAAPAPARAADGMGPGADTGLWPVIIQMIGMLAVVVALLLAVAWVVRRFGPGRGLASGGRDLIRVIAAKPLAPKKFIAIVEAAGSVLTLAVTQDRITCLDKQRAEDFEAALEPEAPPKGFAQRLRALTGETSGPEEGAS